MTLKGEETREAVLRAALDDASCVGLTGLTIGRLADRMQMSKSGLFAHFRSKDRLQLDTLDYAAASFRTTVGAPALAEPAGEPRVRRFMERWIGWLGDADYALPGGCVFVGAYAEFDDLPDGPVRGRLVEQHAELLDSLAMMYRSGVRAGAFRADVDPEEFAHQCSSVALGHHVAARLMHDPRALDYTNRALERLFTAVRAEPAD